MTDGGCTTPIDLPADPKGKIRAHFHSQEARVLYYYWDEGDLIYGLVAFVKKTQKTPPDKIKLAQKRLRQLKRDLKGW